MTHEEFKKKRAEENKKLREYLKGSLPTITKNIATYPSGDTYQITNQGVRKKK